MWERIVDGFSGDDKQVLIFYGIAALFGYFQYVYSVTLMLREHKGPFPLWMHTFYLAHDSSWSYRFYIAATENDGHWFLVSLSIGLAVWSGLELMCLYYTIEWERQETWGLYAKGRVTRGDAIQSICVQLAAFYALVNVLIRIMGADSFMQWGTFTNWVMAAGPGELWRRKNSRDGTSIGLGICIVLGTMWNFAPWNPAVLLYPEYFDTAWYYFAGVVFTFIAIGNLRVLLALPEKKVVPGGKMQIW